MSIAKEDFRKAFELFAELAGVDISHVERLEADAKQFSITTLDIDDEGHWNGDSTTRTIRVRKGQD